MKPWSEDETHLASALRRAGHRVKEIARRLDRDPRSVSYKLRQIGVKKPTPPGIGRPLADEIAAAKAEWATAPLYRPRDDMV